MNGLRCFLCLSIACLFVGCGGATTVESSSPEDIEKRRQSYGKQALGELEQDEFDRAKYNQTQDD